MRSHIATALYVTCFACVMAGACGLFLFAVALRVYSVAWPSVYLLLASMVLALAADYLETR